MSEMSAALGVAASGLRAQTARMKVIAENIANANSTGTTPGAVPYTRQIPTFGQVLDRETGATTVRMTGVQQDQAEFRMRYDPNHPAADATGYVRLPNVNTLVESMDMREAQRAYEANLNVIESARAMLTRTIDLLRR
jgi:flagellar basal-body rod protein FlgC